MPIRTEAKGEQERGHRLRDALRPITEPYGTLQTCLLQPPSCLPGPWNWVPNECLVPVIGFGYPTGDSPSSWKPVDTSEGLLSCHYFCKALLNISKQSWLHLPLCSCGPLYMPILFYLSCCTNYSATDQSPSMECNILQNRGHVSVILAPVSGSMPGAQSRLLKCMFKELINDFFFSTGNSSYQLSSI